MSTHCSHTKQYLILTPFTTTKLWRNMIARSSGTLWNSVWMLLTLTALHGWTTKQCHHEFLLVNKITQRIRADWVVDWSPLGPHPDWLSLSLRCDSLSMSLSLSCALTCCLCTVWLLLAHTGQQQLSFHDHLQLAVHGWGISLAGVVDVFGDPLRARRPCLFSHHSTLLTTSEVIPKLSTQVTGEVIGYPQFCPCSQRTTT